MRPETGTGGEPGRGVAGGGPGTTPGGTAGALAGAAGAVAGTGVAGAGAVDGAVAGAGAVGAVEALAPGAGAGAGAACVACGAAGAAAVPVDFTTGAAAGAGASSLLGAWQLMGVAGAWPMGGTELQPVPEKTLPWNRSFGFGFPSLQGGSQQGGSHADITAGHGDLPARFVDVCGCC